MLTDSERTEARRVARLDYRAALVRLKYGHVPQGGRVFWAERARNAWVAYHAGAPWMSGASQGVAEAHAREAARLRAEVERLTAERDKARKWLGRFRRLAGRARHALELLDLGRASKLRMEIQDALMLTEAPSDG